MNTVIIVSIIVVVGLVLVWFTRGWYSSKVERPSDSILFDDGKIQIRRTLASIYASVTVPGPNTTAPSRAFGILAGFIFGKNQTQKSIAMTSPVLSQSQSTKIAMTAPVISVTTQDDSSDVSFIMPSQYTIDTLPIPQDDRIRILSVPSKIIASIKFDGYVTNIKRVTSYQNKLINALHKLNIEMIGDITIAQYNDPYTPWFMRTNEIWIEVDYEG